MQLPLPGHINERLICDAVCCNKDVDGFNEKNVGRLCLDINSLIPCTALGVQELIKRSNIETFGKNAVVIGRSKNVGLPIFMLLHADGRNETGAMDATVTMCHRFTPTSELKTLCRHADIIITATGVPGLIRADMVKPGAAIIDVGITRVKDEVTGKSKLVGDVDYEGLYIELFDTLHILLFLTESKLIGFFSSFSIVSFDSQRFVKWLDTSRQCQAV